MEACDLEKENGVGERNGTHYIRPYVNLRHLQCLLDSRTPSTDFKHGSIFIFEKECRGSR